MNSGKATVAVIGTGWWSTTAHIPALLANTDADVVLVDRNAEALRRAADHFGVGRAYASLDEALAAERLDGAIVCVNHTAHYPVAKACLEAGLHVMLDKPMVLQAAHAWDLERLARERGRELIVGYPWIYTEPMRRAQEIVRAGELGPIEYVSSLFTSMVVEFLRGNPEAYRPVFNYPVTGPTNQTMADPKLAGGGQGHVQVTHSAATLFHITGLRADRVTAFMQNLDCQVDVADAIAVRFEPVASGIAPVGVLGSTGNIGVGDPGHLEIQVYCANGRLTMDNITGSLYVRTHSGAEQQFGPLPEADRYPSDRPSKNLVDVILGRGPNLSPADTGVRVVELLDAAYRSAARDGQPVRVADLAQPETA